MSVTDNNLSLSPGGSDAEEVACSCVQITKLNLDDTSSAFRGFWSRKGGEKGAFCCHRTFKPFALTTGVPTTKEDCYYSIETLNASANRRLA